MTYIDDFTIFSRDFETHLQYLREVLERIRNAGLKLKISKCAFATDKIVFLGHEISSAGISPNSEKIKAIEKIPAPKTLKAVRSFLGVTSFYRRFIKNYAEIAEPLIQLTKLDESFVWNEKRQLAFDTLKRNLISFPILDHFDPGLPVEIHTDASIVGLGAVLLQQKSGILKVIAYASKTLSRSQRNYGVTQLEFLAVVFAIDKFQYYISNNHRFRVVTDHSAIGQLLKAKDPKGPMARWIVKLSQYDFEVVYRPGRDNIVADYLSRFPLAESQD